MIKIIMITLVLLVRLDHYEQVKTFENMWKWKLHPNSAKPISKERDIL